MRDRLNEKSRLRRGHVGGGNAGRLFASMCISPAAHQLRACNFWPHAHSTPCRLDRQGFLRFFSGFSGARGRGCARGY